LRGFGAGEKHVDHVDDFVRASIFEYPHESPMFGCCTFEAEGIGE